MKKRNLKRRILALTTCTLVLIGALMLPIGAESTTETTAAETPTYTSPIDWLSYPGANLIPYPYANGENYTNQGITYIANTNGSITISGTTSAISYYRLSGGFFGNQMPIPDWLIEGEKYIISGGNNNVDIELYLYSNEGNSIVFSSKNNTYFTMPNGYSYYGIFIRVSSTTNTTIFPMLNVGDVACPYQPYLPYYFQQAFDDGYENGYTEGEEKGYKDGYDNAISKMEEKSKSIFDKAKFEYYIKSNEYEFDKTIFTPNKLHSSVWFESLAAQIENQLWDIDPYWDYVDYVNIIISWEEEKTFDYQILQLYISGDFDVQSGKITTIDGKTYNLDAAQGTSSGNKRKFELETESTSPILVKSITIKVGRPTDLLTAFTLYAPDESYNNGYTDGYKIGYNEAEQGVTHTTYNKGYRDGFSKGKEEGIKLSETGNWRELITSVVDVPSTIFMNLFNFEILGMDMRVAFGSLMALCVIAIILKFTLLR